MGKDISKNWATSERSVLLPIMRQQMGAHRLLMHLGILCGALHGLATTGGITMTKSRIRTNRIALVAICCSLSVLFPTDSFATLWNIACRGIELGCFRDCNEGSQSQACYSQCRDEYLECTNTRTTTKQQTPPLPCYGVRCPLRNPHPPTTVGQPTPQPRPGKPVNQINPVSVSNPNKTNTGSGGPVIQYRQKDADGGHGKGH
jgi:hypothetical protein